MSGEMVPPQYSPSNAARSLTARDRAKCPRRRARSFDEGVPSRAGSAVPRDNSRRSIRLNRALPLFFLRILGNQKLTLRIKRARLHCKLCAFFIQAALGFPLNTPPPTGDLFAPLTPLQGEVPEERGRSGTSLPSRAGSAVPRDIFCSAPPLGCGTFHRFNRLVWASLRLSERSRTIEVRVTTLSPQTCTKSLA